MDCLAPLDEGSLRYDHRTQSETQALDIDPTSNRLLGFTRAVTVTDGNRTPSSIRLHVPYTLDANGSLTSDGQRTFDYDASGRLARTRIATLGSESQVDYKYNAMGQRVFKSQEAGEWKGPREEELGEDFMGWLRRYFGDWMKQEPVQLGQAFVYGDGQLPIWALLGEYDNGSARGKDTTEYIWLPTEDGSAIPIGMARGDRLLAIHSDHLGTPRAMTNHEASLCGNGRTARSATTSPRGCCVDGRREARCVWRRPSRSRSSICVSRGSMRMKRRGVFIT